jgi:hypothetical protein
VLTDGLAQKRVQISGWFVTETRDTPYDGSAETPNPLQEQTRIRVWLLTADVRLGRMFGIQVTSTAPDVTRTAVVVRPTSTFNFSETFRGLGDTSVIAWRRYVTPAGWNITLNGGVSLPTGKTEQPRFRSELDEDSLVPVSRLQRGSGTVDPVFGVSVNKIVPGIFPPGIRWFASGAARVPIAENKFGLRTGASWEIGTGASREIHWHQIVGILRTSWLHRQQDVFEGVPVLVGGGNWIYVSPAVAIAAGPVTFQAEIKLPLYRSLSNRQLDASRSFQLGIVWTPG